MSVDPPPDASASGGQTPPPPGSAPYPGQQYGYPPGFARPPGYGWNPPTPPAPGFYPPPQTRGKRVLNAWWYALGAALLCIGLLIGGAGISAIANALGAQPDSGQTFASGGSTTVHFDAGATKVIFVDAAAGRHGIDCNVSNDAERAVRIERYHGSLALNQWEAAFTVTASQSDDYTIECTGAPSDTFGVGGNISAGTFVAGVFGIVAGAGMTLAGVVALVVVAVLRWRRKSAQSRGQAPPPGPGPSGYGAWP